MNPYQPLSFGDNDIRLVYIGSPHRAKDYGRGHLPEPVARADQILVVDHPEMLHGFILPPWCHIATELHTTKDRSTFAKLENHAEIFAAALACRRRIDRAGA